MRIRTLVTVLLLVVVPLTAHAAKKKKPLAVEVSTTADGLPLVTLTASNAPLSDVAERLAKKLGTTIDVSPAARTFRVTTELDEQPLDLTLRELAPQAYVDAVLTGGGAGKTTVLAIHLRSAGEAAPSLQELAKSRSDVIMFSGHTEDPGIDPLEDTLEVTYRNDRLRVFAKGQPLSVITARIAEALGIPLELIGDSHEVIDVSIADATVEQAIRALTPAVKLYHRKDLATYRMTPVRLVVQEPFEPKATP
jgi:hypothetical protein